MSKQEGVNQRNSKALCQLQIIPNGLPFSILQVRDGDLNSIKPLFWSQSD